ncbi:MAG: hypothetical protein ACI97B_000801, partial [Verrucomicrobiales bacterium]
GSYIAENWMTLTTVNTTGDMAVGASIDLAGVATAKDSALVAMDAVPTIAETLAAARTAALDELATALSTYQEGDYTAESWTALNTARTEGDIAINAATDLAGVTTAEDSAEDSAVAAMDTVPTFVETMAAARMAALDELATAMSTYLISKYYTPENWSGLISGSANCLSK